MRRLLLLGLILLVASCADGFAPRGDNDDEKYQEGASAASARPAIAAPPTARPLPTSTPPPTPTPRPTTTPAPTAMPVPTATPTPTPTPMFPPVLIGEPLRATIGSSTTQVIATDIDGTIASVRILVGPDGLEVVDGSSLRFTPVAAGSFLAEVVVTDSQGLRARGAVTLLGRYRGHPQALVGLGDSVPSGHGLDGADFFGGDRCWRAGNSYPRRAFNLLNAAGVFPPGQGEFALLACSGYDVDDLYERAVGGGFDDIAPADGARTQLDWTVRTNPRFVTLTIGANDTGFVGPEKLFLADGITLDRPQIERRMTVIREDLRLVLDRLVAATDATVFVTNYYNPTAEKPQGIATCRLECFRSAADEVVGRMNATIEEVARSYPDDRVVFVDFATPFVAKGAPNGYGPDGLREGGFGVVGDLVAGQVKEVHPYCARGDTVGESWISAVDCVHPDDRGTAELASIMANAILGYVAGVAHALG